MSGVEMKDSGVEWLGEIPAHWDVRNFKYIARLEYGDSLKAEDRVDDEVPVFGSNGVVGYHDVSNTLAPAIVVGRKGSFGKVNYSNIPVFAIDTTYFVDERATSQDIRWVYYFLQILELDKSSKDSAVPGLGREEVYSFRSALPPLDEQRAIASYLDAETTKIDALVAKTERLNELLGEKRVALISRAVTKGLDADVETKESGVEWLGEIPRHWDVRNFKYVARLLYGDSLKAEDRVEDDVPVYGSNGVVGHHNIANTASPTIIVGRKGSYGKVNYSTVPSFAIDTTYYVDCRATSEDLRWLYYLLQILDLDESSKDSAVPGLSREDVYLLRLPFPPLAEQRAIAAHLDAETARIDALIAKNDQLIALLGEKRTTLISAAVTGKISVDLTPPPAPPQSIGEGSSVT